MGSNSEINGNSNCVFFANYFITLVKFTKITAAVNEAVKDLKNTHPHKFTGNNSDGHEYRKKFSQHYNKDFFFRKALVGNATLHSISNMPMALAITGMNLIYALSYKNDVTVTYLREDNFNPPMDQISSGNIINVVGPEPISDKSMSIYSAGIFAAYILSKVNANQYKSRS